MTTENISTYRFDFEREAEDLRQRLGPQHNNLIFIETVIVPPEKAGGRMGLRMLPVGEAQFMEAHAEQACEAIFSHYGPSSGVAPLKKDGQTLGHAIGMREKENFTEAFGEDKKDFLRLFALLHETGHALINGPVPTPNDPSDECAADAYAALVCLQRFGNEAAELLSLISWSRITKSIVNDTRHLTTPVLDKIIADSATLDLSQMSQADIVDLAKSYAKDWTPAPSVLSAARPDFVQNGPISFNRLVEKCLAPGSDNFSFYIAERFLKRYMAPEGMTFEGTKVWLPDEYRQDVASALDKRSGGRSAQQIFNAAMSKPRAESAHRVQRKQSAVLLP